MNNTAAIPATIISGFLGSGKTTLLNRIMVSDPKLRIAVMVNDFGQINIDASMIVNNNGQTIDLANGCICCSIADDLVGQLESLFREKNAPEYLLIEASGVSDPGRIARILNYPQFRGRLELDAILTVIDAGKLPTLEGELRQLAMTQLEAADIVILNKTDQASADELAIIKRDWLFPDSRVYETQYAHVPLPLIISTHIHSAPDTGGDCSDEPHQHPGEDHTNIFESVSWQSPQAVNLKKLRAVIESLPTGIYRAKGIFLTDELPNTPVVLQQVGSRIDWRRGNRNMQHDASSIVLIGRRGDFDSKAILAQLDGLIIADGVH